MAFFFFLIYEKENVYIKNMDVGCKAWESTLIEPVKVRHPTKLSVYIAEVPSFGISSSVPYITTSKLSAKKFYTKKQALKYGRKFGGCYVDVVWHYQKSMKLEVIDLWS